MYSILLPIRQFIMLKLCENKTYFYILCLFNSYDYELLMKFFNFLNIVLLDCFLFIGII